MPPARMLCKSFGRLCGARESRHRKCLLSLLLVVAMLLLMLAGWLAGVAATAPGKLRCAEPDGSYRPLFQRNLAAQLSLAQP